VRRPIRAERLRRNRDQDGEEQEHEVACDRQAIDAPHQAEDRMVVLPHDPDDEEGEDVGQQIGPHLQQLLRELAIGQQSSALRLRHREAEGEEGDREGEDAVASTRNVHIFVVRRPYATRMLGACSM